MQSYCPSSHSITIDMEIESENQPKTGLVARWWGGFKALPGKCMAKVVEVAKSVKKLGQDDPRRIVHSIKVGMALALVSLIYYLRPLYDGFGVAGIWAVLTVVVIFEFTVGATLSKGLNRGFATLLAGALGVGAHHLAALSGEKGEPILLGLFVFLLATAATFSRFFPRIKARYDYGVVIFILTFSLVTVSGYRVEEILHMAHQRLSTIFIGGATCIFIALFVCPVWAGQDLHKLISLNMEKLATYLEGFGGECFQVSEDGEIIVVSKDNKSFLQAYKSVLNSKTAEENLAIFARWEPGHGRFLFRHPWKQYLKVGALTRQCAYQIEALNGYIHSEIQAPHEVLTRIQESCTTMSLESGKALKALSLAIKTMTDPSPAHLHLEKSKNAVNDLKIALKTTSLEKADILAIIPAATIASILIEIVTNVEKIADSVHELSRLAHFKSAESSVSQEKPHLLHKGSVIPILDGDVAHVTITLHEIITRDDSFNKGKTVQKVGV